MNNLFWFRRDLRLTDNCGLAEALKNGSTICCFIYDKNILDCLEKDDRRIGFINQSLIELNSSLQQYGTCLLVKYGEPQQLIPTLVKKYNIDNVYANEDYEPYAIKRDNEVAKKVNLSLYKDHVIFSKNEILNKSGKPYTKFTPYKKAWLKTIDPYHYENHNVNSNNFQKLKKLEFYDISRLDFKATSIILAGESGARQRLQAFINVIDDYATLRNLPALDKTSRLSVDLRFGTISIRNLVQLALSSSSKGSEAWLNELIWRDFFSQVLYNFPYVVNHSYKEKFRNLKYPNDNSLFIKWCKGETGYPIVDAGMRQLNQTGFMHNRLRLITATFLVKDLLIDWRWGEAYFDKQLLDYELASNNGNWQWCASTGCDSQPYFRIFNPDRQAARFDPESKYIKQFIPELKEADPRLINTTCKNNNSAIGYITPIVEHSLQVTKVKELYKSVNS